MSNEHPSASQTAVTAGLAMTAFAANSILCRLALGAHEIDAVGFTSIRLISGAVVLLAIAHGPGGRRTQTSRGSWWSAAALLAYALLFSLAYVRLNVSTGTLILFALVQTTMIGWGISSGERLRPTHWVGLAAAVGGLAYLVSPGLAAPPVAGALMMGAAGVAWGAYSLRGRGSINPLITTTDNFVRSVPAVLVIAIAFRQTIDLSSRGVLLALASGTLASGMGYVLWYRALRGLSATRAAAVQLTVPVIAAAGGLVVLGEEPSVRLVVSAALILGGVGLTLAGRGTNILPR